MAEALMTETRNRFRYYPGAGWIKKQIVREWYEPIGDEL